MHSQAEPGNEGEITSLVFSALPYIILTKAKNFMNRESFALNKKNRLNYFP